MNKHQLSPPALVVHADWGSDPVKRWMCIAKWNSENYRVLAPQPVGELASLFDGMLDLANGGSCLFGFDFPIGMPVAYTRRAGIEDFRDMLTTFGHGDWADFYQLAERPEQITLQRPFYPRRPGASRQAHLLSGLGVQSVRDLLRRCEQPTRQRSAASPLFWTLGAKQVGRAAIIGWRDLIAPALTTGMPVSLWPFDGDLQPLLGGSRIAIAETYPAEACVQLGLQPPGRGWSKRSQSDRRAQALALFDWVGRRDLRLESGLQLMLHDGFGARPDGEDAFDALLGVLAMLEVVLGHRPAGAPADATIRRLEGWILGLEAQVRR